MVSGFSQRAAWDGPGRRARTAGSRQSGPRCASARRSHYGVWRKVSDEGLAEVGGRICRSGASRQHDRVRSSLATKKHKKLKWGLLIFVLLCFFVAKIRL